MKEKRIRRSFQREQIYQLLAQGGHWSAEKIYELLKKEIPTLSLATVYRNLHALQEEGRAREIALDGWDRKLWEAARTPHLHFVCRVCHRVEDLDVNLSALEGLLVHVPGKVEHIRGFVYGICNDCLKQHPSATGSNPTEEVRDADA